MGRCDMVRWGEGGKGRRGHAETRRHGDTETRDANTTSSLIPFPHFPMSAPRFSPSPHPRVPVSPPPSPLLPLLPFPHLASPRPGSPRPASLRGRTCASSTLCYISSLPAAGLPQTRCSAAALAARSECSANNDATSQSTITELPLASDSSSSHQSHCTCNLTSSRSLPATPSVRFDLWAGPLRVAHPRRGEH